MRYLCGMLMICLAGLVQGAEPSGKVITINTAMGTSLQGYIAGPERATRAILLLHDRWGMNETMRQWVDRYAAKGYLALTIDVFDGRASNNMELATEIMNSVDPEWIKQDVLAGLKYLAAPRRAVFTLGAGLGGWQSFQAALLAPEQVAATVVLYGDMEVTAKDTAKIHSPILGVFGKHDLQVTHEAVNGYQAALKKPQSPHRFITLDVGHGFIDPFYPDYNQVIADDAWVQIDRFLDSK